MDASSPTSAENDPASAARSRPWSSATAPTFELAAGSVTGSRHRAVGKNNQDAWAIRCDRASDSTLRTAIAVVCDGCSSGQYSEVGAQFGAQFVATTIEQCLQDCPGKTPWRETSFWRRVERNVLGQLQSVATAMGGLAASLVKDYFLFTIVGALVVETEVLAFSLGDGALFINGHSLPLGPFANNAPPYLAYRLLNPNLAETTALQFQLHGPWPIAEVDSVLVGTDGVLDLVALEARSQPGKTEPIGPLSQFWQDDRYFRNADAVRRKLATINREVTKPDWAAQRLMRQSGLLPDDTTLVVLRHRL